MSAAAPPSPLTVRYFAGARAAAGTGEERIDPTALPAPTMTGLLKWLSAARGAPLAAVLPACAFLVDGLSWHDHEAGLPAGATIDVLPPFAGG